MISESVRTDDGSSTRRHPVTGELYHARDGALTETREKYLGPARLAERLRQGPVRLLDVGFGIGLACIEALALPAPHGLHIDTLEREADAFAAAGAFHPGHPLPRALHLRREWRDGTRRVVAHVGDLRQTLRHIPPGLHLIFHDPFQPLHNTEAWTVEVFRLQAERLHPRGLWLTYSQSRIVRAGLREAGFHPGDTPAGASRRGGTAAALDPDLLAHPLAPPPEGWGEPFRDPDLRDSPARIRSRREAATRNRRKSS